MGASTNSERDFGQPTLAIAIMAMAIVEHRTQHPFLRVGVPIGPSIAADVVGATSAAHDPDFRRFPNLGHYRMVMESKQEGSLGGGRLVQSG